MASSLTVILCICAFASEYFFMCHAMQFVHSSIHEAAVNGDKNRIINLIAHGENVNARSNDDKQTPVHEAAHYDNVDAAQILLEKGAYINARDAHGWTPLHEAAQNGNVRTAELLIQKGADVNAQNIYKSTPLHFASRYGHKNVVELLLKHGARCNIKDYISWTPLFKAAYNNYADIADLLIKRGAGIMSRDDEGRTPLDVAVAQGSTSVINLLKSKTLSYVRPAVKACQSYVQQNKGNTIDSPWMAALGYLVFKGGYEVTFDCSGVVVSELFVLTAAHCVKPSRAPFVVRLGGKVVEGVEPINHQIKTIIRHPEYSDQMEANDIALIGLQQKIYFTNNVAPACLQTDLPDERTDVKLIAIGWKSGKLHVANELLKTQLNTMPLEQCKEAVSNYKQIVDFSGLENGITSNQYCAYDAAGREKCHGDNATILFKSSNARVASVVGVINFGIGCSSGLPAIYTRVAHHIDWIEDNVWQQN